MDVLGALSIAAAHAAERAREAIAAVIPESAGKLSDEAAQALERVIRESVEDRRGFSRGAGVAVGGGAALLIVIVAGLLGVDPRQLAALLGPGQGGQPAAQQADRPANREEDQLAHFANVIFHDTEVVWDDLFQSRGRQLMLLMLQPRYCPAVS